MPDRISAPSTASPMTRQVTGITSPKSAVAATPAKARTAVSSTVLAMNPNSTAAAAGISAATQRLPGRQARSV